MSVRSAHGVGLVHRAEPALPMTTCFQSALVARAAFSGLHTMEKKKRKKSKKQQVSDIIILHLHILLTYKHCQDLSTLVLKLHLTNSLHLKKKEED